MSSRSGSSSNQPGGGSRLRAASRGEEPVSSRAGTARSIAGARATFRGGLTENGNHLAQGAVWRLDTAGGPRPYDPGPKRAMVPGFVGECKCGQTKAYGPDPAVAGDLALRKCFNCKVRAVAALDPRGPDDSEAREEAIATIHQQEIDKRRKGGCDCDLPVGRLFNKATCRPLGWTQGHTGQSRSQLGDWEGGEVRAENRRKRYNKLPWWDEDKGPTAEKTPSLIASRSTDVVGKFGGHRYYPCKSFVYVPTEHAHRPSTSWSNDLPDAELKLDFVYGYKAGSIVGAPNTEAGARMGSDVQDNLRWLDHRRIVYFTAAVAIVYDIPLHSQRFFCGHDDHITCLAVSPSRKSVATGQMGRYPKIFVWNPLSSPDPTDTPLREASRRLLHHDIPALFCMETVPPDRLTERKISSLCFVNEETLVALGADDKNSFLVWDLGTGECVYKGSGGATPVYLVRGIFGWADSGGKGDNACTRWSRLENQSIRVVTTGVKHVGFWKRNVPSAEFPHGEWTMSKIELGDNPLCVTFALSADGKTTEMFLGHQDGSISCWVASKLEYRVEGAHEKGATQMFWTVQGLVTGGADCALKVWPRVGSRLQSFPSKQLSLRIFAASQMVGIPVGTGSADYLVPKSTDVLPDGKILLGTTSAQIFIIEPVDTWKTDGTGLVDPALYATLLLDAHYASQDSHSLEGLATFPQKGFISGQVDPEKATRGMRLNHMFVTCGPDRTWRIWNTKNRRCEYLCPIWAESQSSGQTKHVTFPMPSVVDVAPNGLLLAIGFVDGGWCVYMDVGEYDGASHQLAFNSVMIHKEFAPYGIPIPRKGWRLVYMTDVSRRKAQAAQLQKLQQKLNDMQISSRTDPFIAQHTSTRHELKAEIDRIKSEMASNNDFASSMPVTVIKFAPNGLWLVVGARDGKMNIFSLKNLQVQGKTQGLWTSVTELDLDHSLIHEDAFLDQDGVDQADFRERSERYAARHVIPGEQLLRGLRGEIRKLGQCKGHVSGIAHADWSLDSRLLRSTSETCELLFWNAPNGSMNAHPDECRDTVWATHTVPFGWHVQGIWPVDGSGSHVCTLDVSRGDGEVKVCATGDVSGHLKLFRFPCVGEKAMFRSYIGDGMQARKAHIICDSMTVFAVCSHTCVTVFALCLHA